MKPAELYDLLKKAQEPKGYYFNKDREWAVSYTHLKLPTIYSV